MPIRLNAISFKLKKFRQIKIRLIENFSERVNYKQKIERKIK